MRHVFETMILLAGCAWSVATAQDAPASLQEQLKAQYQPVQVIGGQLADKGTVLAVQKAGILGVTMSTWAMCFARYQEGELHPPGKFCQVSVASASRWLNKGEKVVTTKIAVNLKRDNVTFNIATRDALLKSQVIFQFAKGSLEKTAVPQVEDVIGQVLAIDNSPDEPPAVPAQTAEQQEQPPAAPEPAHVQLGQTTDQVQGILGQPEKIVDLGPKQIYVYKDLKVIFMNGKVSDVQ